MFELVDLVEKFVFTTGRWPLYNLHRKESQRKSEFAFSIGVELPYSAVGYPPTVLFLRPFYLDWDLCLGLLSLGSKTFGLELELDH